MRGFDMGVSTDAHLIYGVRLGGTDAGWQFKEVDEDGIPVLPWLAEDADLTEEAIAEFLSDEHEIEATDYFNDALKTATGVELVTTQHSDFPDYFLAVVNIEAWRGRPKRVEDFTITAEQEQALTKVLATLGITPNEPSGWYIASYTDY